MTSFWKRRGNAETRLTIEGWGFLVFLMFITVGAILRNVNLLILMAGLMYAPLILHWRSCNRLLRKVKAKRVVPQRLHAGQPTKLSWTVHNESDQTTAWNIMISDQLIRDNSMEIERNKQSLAQRVRSTLVREAESFEQTVWRLAVRLWNWISNPESWRGESGSLMMIDHVEGGLSRTGVWQVTFPVRGRYFVGPSKMTSTSLLGLQACVWRFPEVKASYVAPAMGKLSRGWGQRLQSVRSGDDAGSRRRGMDQEEFYALRPWRSGDSRKHIHWRTTARYGQPIVRQFDQNVDQDLVIILDLYCPAGRSRRDDEQISSHCRDAEIALSFATTVLSEAKQDVRGRITLGVCGQHKDFFPGRQSDFVALAMKALAIAQPTSHPATAETLLEAATVAGDGTPVFVISTRPKPDLLLLASGSQEAERAVRDVNHSINVKRLQQINAGVAWVQVNSEMFQSVFAMDARSGHSLGTRGIVAATPSKAGV